MNENWVPVPGTTGYEISDQGRIRSYRTAQGHPSDTPRLLSPGNSRGYLHVKLGRDRPNVKIHILALEVFEGPRPAGTVARHLNGDSTDNRLSNLRWGTSEENYDDRHGHGTDNTGSRNGRATLTESQVREIYRQALSSRPYSEIMEQFGVTRMIVSNIRCGRTWRHVTGLPEDYTRTRAGSGNGRARLNEDQVREIRRLLKQGSRQKDLAEQFSVSSQTVSLISQGKIWTHVQDHQ